MPVLLFVVFIVLPLAELYVIIQVGQAIGVLPTLALLVLTGFVGAALARSQGRAVWQRFNDAMGQGRMPGREVMDGAMILFGGALLLSPGFITDALGIGLLLPPGRALIRSMVRRAAERTPAGRPVFFVYERYGAPGAGRRSGGSTRGTASGRRAYDVEGSAREVPEEEGQLPGGSERGG